MKVFVFLLFVFGQSVVSSQLCQMEAGDWIGVSETWECMETVAFNKTQFAASIETLQKAFPLYVFVDIAADSPSKQYAVSVNIRRQLDEIEAEALAGKFLTMVEYEERVAALFLSLNDGHTTYTLPGCLSAFIAYQPFHLISYVSSAGFQEVAIGWMNDAVVNALSSQFGIHIPSNLTGSRLVSIDGRPAIETIEFYARHGTGSSKDIGCRFNLAVTRVDLRENKTSLLGGGFESRSLRHPFPKLRNGQSHVDYTLETTSGDFISLRVPWIVKTSQTFDGVGSFLRICNEAPSSNKATAAKKQAQVVADPSLHRSTLNQGRQMPGIEPLLMNSAVSFFGIPDAKVGVMVIPGFGSTKGFVAPMQQGFQMLHDKGYDRLIVDLSNNGGGSIGAGMALIDFLFPDDKNPPSDLYALNDMIHSSLADDLVNAAGNQSPTIYTYWTPQNWIDPSTGEPFQSASPWWFPGQAYLRGGINGTYSQKFRDNFTADLDELPPPPPDEHFSPRSIRVLSNGFCGSTCALVSRHMQEFDHVKSVVVGGVHRHPMGISTTPGGEVTDLASVLEMIGQLGELNNPLTPPGFVTTADMRFTIREAYPWTQKDPGAPTDLPLEFFFEAAAYHLPYSMETAMNPEKVWFQVLHSTDF